MRYLSSLDLPGALALWCALLFSLSSLWGYSRVLRGEGGALGFSRRAYGAFAVSILLAAVAMVYALATRDFRIEYVYRYSSLELPAPYHLAAFWAGQKGSFLIWLLWGSLLGLLVARSAGRREPAVMVVYTLTLVALLLILVGEDPFVMLRTTPPDGLGLNPLLQNDWMVIHPPIMFVGYAASAVPFAFAMAALWRRDYDGWAARALPWALGGLVVLGLAILLGGRWAYMTLGWGGYWGWDPVENASLIPFLLGAILIHGLYLERARGLLRRTNFVLAALVYLSVLYGTFLTRSGVLAHFSVHSFVDLGSAGWLAGLLAFFGAGGLVLLVLRLPGVPSRPHRPDGDPLASRAPLVALGILALLLSTVAVTLGTSAPLLTGLFGTPGQVAAEFYDRMNLPIFLLVALLLALVPCLSWEGTAPRALGRRLLPSALAALALTGVAAALGVRSPPHLLFVFLALLALGTNLGRVAAALRPAGRAAPGGTRARGPSSAGGYLSHVGVGLLLIGLLASSGYETRADTTLELGRPRRVGDLELTFRGIREARSPGEADSLVVGVERPDGSAFEARPERFRDPRSGRITWRPDVRSGLLRDLYVSPRGYSPAEPGGARPTLAVEVIRKPLILLVWLGFAVLLAGAILAGVERLRQALRLDRPERAAAGE